VARGVASGTYTLTNFTRDAGTLTKEITPLTTVVLAGTDVDVSTHVGHRVSVTGSYASFELASYPRGELATGPALMAKPAAAAAKEDGGRKPIRTFTVKSLKMVADTCSQPAD
jgi:hypothetical protein